MKISHPQLLIKITKGLLLTASMVVMPAQADWSLDNSNSSVSYLSTKVVGDGKASASETNHFTALSGTVTDAGMAEVVIDLSSVETNVDIRNERMGKHVFELENYSSATIKAVVPADALKVGTHNIDLTFELDFHGVKKELNVPVIISSSENSIVVTSTQPVLLLAADFGATDGLLMLTKLAKLFYIPTTVPVSFSLSFDK